jgi:hypothetical protein
LILTVSGCSASRKLSRKGGNGGDSGNVTVADVFSRNITSRNFNIPKCEVEIKTDELNEKFIAGIKYEYPGKYLITLRTNLGIELARIFITSDTILANDRINRVLYFGKPSVLAYKYGVPFEIIPLIFGDLVFSMDNPAIMVECSGEKSELADVIAGRRISYNIDCVRKKISGSVVEGSGMRDNANVQYSDFRNMSDMVVPSKIEISNNGSSNMITLQIDRIEQWEGSIEFIPGNRYNRIELR